MKRLIMIFSFCGLMACEKTIEEKESYNQPNEPKTETCDCYVWESKTTTKFIDGKPVAIFQWVKGRYFSDDCEDDRLTFQENGHPAEVRCTVK